MEIYIAFSQERVVQQLKTAASKIDTYKVPLGLSTAQVDGLKADALYCEHIWGVSDIIDTYSQSVNKFKDILFGKIDETLGTFPAIPVLGVAPPAVAANARKRFADLIQFCKLSSNFNESVAENLGVLAPVNPSDPNTAKPDITKVLVLPDRIKIGFKKDGWFGVRGYHSYDGVTWTKGEKDPQSPYEDTRPNQATNVPEERHFKFRLVNSKGEEIGLESDPIKVVATIYP
jgi:hypothetical protein